MHLKAGGVAAIEVTNFSRTVAILTKIKTPTGYRVQPRLSGNVKLPEASPRCV